MPLEIPKLDDLRYKEILDDVLARIRVHNPEWTNLGEGDPGVTILQLFAYMTDQLMQRAGQIPERNRRQFLSLLRIPLRPAQPATGLVTFSNERGPLKEVTLPPNLDVRSGQVPFRTQYGLQVLPVEANVYYKRPLSGGNGAEADVTVYAQFAGDGGAPVAVEFYRTELLRASADLRQLAPVDLLADTIDRSLWIALLARPKEPLEAARRALADKVLSLGVLPAPAVQRTLAPQARTFELSARQAPLVVEAATNRFDPVTGTPLYNRLKISMTANVLSEAGVITVRLPGYTELQPWVLSDPLQEGTGELPPHLDEPKLAERIITWLRLRLDSSEFAVGQLARIAWLGINADMVRQEARAEAELVGRGSGEPDQSFTLVNRSVRPGSVQLTVAGQPWQEVEDLLAAGPEVPPFDKHSRPGLPPPALPPSKVFALDPASGVISFGDGVRGARPPAGADIRASYWYGGGKAGNVDAGTLTRAPNLPFGLKVTNPLPTWGGVDPESVAEAERNIANYLKHRDRLVTAEDFRDIVLATPGADVGRVEVLPQVNPDLPQDLLPGVVTLLVLPGFDDTAEAPPRIDRAFLDLIANHIEPRRLITTEVFIRPPTFRPIYLSIGIEVAPRHAYPVVRETVNRQVKEFLSPLRGGPDRQGWPINKWVTAKELFGFVAKLEGVAYVRDVLLSEGGPEPLKAVKIAGLELPWLVSVDTHHGDPAALGTVAQPLPNKRILPVPSLPQG